MRRFARVLAVIALSAMLFLGGSWLAAPKPDNVAAPSLVGVQDNQVASPGYLSGKIRTSVQTAGDFAEEAVAWLDRIISRGMAGTLAYAETSYLDTVSYASSYSTYMPLVFRNYLYVPPIATGSAIYTPADGG